MESRNMASALTFNVAVNTWVAVRIAGGEKCRIGDG